MIMQWLWTVANSKGWGSTILGLVLVAAVLALLVWVGDNSQPTF